MVATMVAPTIYIEVMHSSYCFPCPGHTHGQFLGQIAGTPGIWAKHTEPRVLF